MSQNYSKLLIREYKYWSVYIHENQSYLGRCVIWCKRENAVDLTDATEEEQRELFFVSSEFKNGIIEVFQPDWFNYSFLGNEVRHLHGHFIPRYEKPREFRGYVFEDKLYGHNYKTDHTFKIPSKILLEIKLKIKEALS
ncbi:MAG: HIT family protein [Candidatus Pacebacteria bacterium]|nr:HIT family protein [Candidatus Paceibacterota bacterium]